MDDTVLIEVSSEAIAQRAFVEHIKTITPSMQSFILTLIDAAIEQRGNESADAEDENAPCVVTRKFVQAKLKDAKQGSSDSSISLRLGELKKLDIAELTTSPLGGRGNRRLNYYTIPTFSPLAELTDLKQQKPSSASRRVTKEIVHYQRELFKQEEGSLLLTDHKDLIFFHEQVFNGILDACMRISSKDTRKNISVELIVAGKPLMISASCSSNEESDIAKLNDQRAMRNIISLCKAEIMNRRMKLQSEHGSDFNPRLIPNLFHLDIHDLCKLMGMSTASNNIANVSKMMQRLADTKFTVDASLNPWFRDQFSSLYTDHEDSPQSDLFEFQFLNNLEIARYNDKISDMFGAEVVELKPRFYTFSLENRMYLTLISSESTNLFLSHPGLSKDQSGIIQRFYNWARAFISGRQKAKEYETWYTIHEMKDFLTPAVRLDNFRTYFLKALKRFDTENSWDNENNTGRVLVYGYYVNYKRENGVEMFRIERDTEDPIVGNNSRHNMLLRQKQHELLTDESL